DDVLRKRLRARPAWRGWDEARIDEMLEFAEWVRTASTDPPMTLLDTTAHTVGETADVIEKWVRARLS
ncbi:MAG TPA: nucleoside kinase, partial [Actinophytocola sp.]|nr:nucleoside kinase [Actinophytocola sp.]